MTLPLERSVTAGDGSAASPHTCARIQKRYGTGVIARHQRNVRTHQWTTSQDG
jgi:hypothetical protein